MFIPEKYSQEWRPSNTLLSFPTSLASPHLPKGPLPPSRSGLHFTSWESRILPLPRLWWGWGGDGKGRGAWWPWVPGLKGNPELASPTPKRWLLFIFLRNSWYRMEGFCPPLLHPNRDKKGRLWTWVLMGVVDRAEELELQACPREALHCLA